MSALKLYYNPLSTNARRVWIALLEKQLDFELIPLKLNGDQFQPDFLAISPFHHVPVLADGDFHIIETLAILDYLEAKYPAIALLPEDAKERAIVRMVEMVTVNELVPVMSPLVRQTFGGEADSKDLEKSHQNVAVVLRFFEGLLVDRSFLAAALLSRILLLEFP